ncbi:Protein DGCR14 [Strongyloides ratti]|uniref:Protein DGCR14 n=1 Tax=Strongyloides ratti TaxID=34506 RepID=A0A090LGY6_STRRB|nr:Protein DGCR14 [Strongyloides ratti]CEF66725.1 Protein DGCR14 [Strongyloides ratti]
MDKNVQPTTSKELFKVPDVNTKVSQKKINPKIQTVEKRKIERHVLDEKTFITGLERIIERDYYPELKKLRAQKEYSDAVKEGDTKKIEELKKCYSVRTLSQSTPSTVATPRDDASDSEDEKCDKEPKTLLDDYNVDSYLNRYTSEDNRDFDFILKKQNEDFKKSHKWIYKSIEDHNARHEAMIKPLPEADEQALAIANNESSKVQQPIGWKSSLETGFFGPLEEAPLTVAEYVKQNQVSKISINKEGTRLDENIFNNKQIEKVKPRYDIFARPPEIDITGKRIEEDKVIEQILDNIQPEEGNNSPEMTWGYIDGTPFRLDGNDITTVGSSTPSFRISNISEKEQIARNLIDNIIASKEAKKRENSQPINNGSVRSNSLNGKIMGMTPASQKLMKTKLGFSSISTPYGSSWQSNNSAWDTPSTSRGMNMDSIRKLIKKKTDKK